MARKLRDGDLLEARVQRLVLSQGVFAERGLIPAASSDHRLLATDIDVLATEYQFNFCSGRFHYECKSGKTPTLDRILWMKGVKDLLGAGESILVLRNFDAEAIEFAKRLGIKLMNIGEIDRIEKGLGIHENWWPGRSSPTTFAELKNRWQEHWSTKRASEEWAVAKARLAFVEIDGWENSNYRTLNKLFRMLEELGRETPSSGEYKSFYCYILACLCVRLTQIILGVCCDVLSHEPTARAQYLTQRLIFGDNNPKFAISLINGTVALLMRSVGREGERLTADTNRLTSAPAYCKDFIKLVEEFISNPLDARFVPICMEFRMFGPQEIPSSLCSLRSAIDRGQALTDFCAGFLIRNFSIKSEILSELQSGFFINLGSQTKKS